MSFGSDIPDHLSREVAQSNRHLTARELSELRRLVRDLRERQVESLRLYEPLPHQDRFHSCRVKECMMVKGNQVGGSLAAAVELARAVTGQDPYRKYPEKDGIAACLVYGEDHIGRVLHRYLFRWGPFDIIRDKDTSEWRVYRPWEPDKEVMGKFGDIDRDGEQRPAPPLIPKRFIKNIAWEKRAKKIFSLVEFTTGWTLYALNSAGDFGQGQGFRCNLFMIDEDLAKSGWYEEIVGRCSKPPGGQTTGLIRWDAIPHAKTDDILEMIDRADQEAHNDVPRTVCIQVGIDENPFLSEETREENKRIWKTLGEDVYLRRAHGELKMDSIRMYPMYDKRIHTVYRPLTRSQSKEEQDGKKLRAEVQRILTESDGIVPEDWCRYLVVDPGYNVMAALFFCVPPPSLGKYCIQYDELYVTDCTARKFAMNLKPKCEGKVFQAFLVDMHGGRLRSSIDGRLPVHEYERHMEEEGIECEMTGSRFSAGSDNIEQRELALRAWLEIRGRGTDKEIGYPTYMLIPSRCPNTDREMTKFKKKTKRVGGRDMPTNEGIRGPHTHTVECLEMMAAHGAAYVKPPTKRVETLTDYLFERWEQNKRKNRRSSVTLGPMGDSTW